MNIRNFTLRGSLFILFLPLITLITSFLLRAASGPFWQYADPCYIYLFDAFQIIKGHPPRNFSHPGTPLQVLIAFIICIFNFGRPAAEAVNQVLMDPEFYLRIVYVFLAFCSFLTSVILGAFVYRKTNDKFGVLLTQLMGLSFLILPSINNSSYPVIPVVANISAEPVFISIMNLFNFFLLKLYFSESKSQKLSNVLLLALVCGFGLATKLNFFFVFLSALFVIPNLKKILFVVICSLSFVFCTIPILGKYPELFRWIGEMAGHCARYGTGAEKFIDWKTFFTYLNMMAQHYWFFIISALGLWIWSSLVIIKDGQNRRARFIWALSFCCLLNILATAKYFSFHYLLPGLGLYSSMFLLFYLNQKIKYKILKPLTTVFILMFISVCIFYTIPYYQKLLVVSRDIHNFNENIKAKFPECTIIPSTTVDVELFLSQEEILLRANGANYRLDTESLTRLYPHSYYFYSEEVTSPDPDVESYGIWNFKERVYADDLMAACPCAIFIKYTSDFSVYPYQVRLLDQSKYLNAYLLINSTEKEANGLFAQALYLFKKGDYQQAMILGLKAKQLNYEPRGQLDYVLMMIYRELLKSRSS